MNNKSVPIKNDNTDEWEVYKLAYCENGENFYKVYKFKEYCDAIVFYLNK